MKLLVALLFALAGNGLLVAQTCSVPSIRGLKLGMTPQAVDALFVVDNDAVIFDDVQYKLTFTRNRLVRIDADYDAKDEWRNTEDFSVLYAKKLNLPSEWKSFVQNESLLSQLEEKKAALLIKYSPEYKDIVAIDYQIRLLHGNDGRFVQCPQFRVTIIMMDFRRPHVTIRLTNRSTPSDKFEP